MKFLNTTWTSFRSTVKGFDTPHQLALGVALGMVIGMIPKDSILPYAIGLIALLTTANILSMAVSAHVFSGISPLLDPISHPIGEKILTFEPLQPTLTMLFQIPVVPWTRFENTVVTGSLFLGLLLTIPIYFIAIYCFKKFGSTIYFYFSRTRAARWLVGHSPSQLQES